MCFLLISAPVPLCPGLSSSPTVCEFIHRKCRGALWVAGLMRSDVASPASRELSMSGRSARGKQTVDKIFNTALPVHGSNTSEKAELLNPKEKKKIIISPTSSLHSSRLGGFIKFRVQKPLVNRDLTESGGKAGVDTSLQDDLWIPNPSLPSFQGGKASLIQSESSKVHHDLSQSRCWYQHSSLYVLYILFLNKKKKKKLSHTSLLVALFFGLYSLWPASFQSPGGAKKTYGGV